MGNSASQTGRKEKARSDGIDEQIEEDNKKYKRECKILLLGASPPLPFFHQPKRRSHHNNERLERVGQINLCKANENRTP